MLTKQHAQKIVEKLNAKIHTGKKAHDLAVVYYEGKRVASFGVRRGSSKDLGHDHIPHDLHVSPHNCMNLAQCPMSREDWIKMMAAKGKIQG